MVCIQYQGEQCFNASKNLIIDDINGDNDRNASFW